MPRTSLFIFLCRTWPTETWRSGDSCTLSRLSRRVKNARETQQRSNDIAEQSLHFYSQSNRGWIEQAQSEKATFTEHVDFIGEILFEKAPRISMLGKLDCHGFFRKMYAFVFVFHLDHCSRWQLLWNLRFGTVVRSFLRICEKHSCLCSLNFFFIDCWIFLYWSKHGSFLFIGYHYNWFSNLEFETFFFLDNCNFFGINCVVYALYSHNLFQNSRFPIAITALKRI